MVPSPLRTASAINAASAESRAPFDRHRLHVAADGGQESVRAVDGVGARETTARSTSPFISSIVVVDFLAPRRPSAA